MPSQCMFYDGKMVLVSYQKKMSFWSCKNIPKKIMQENVKNAHLSKLPYFLNAEE